MYPKYDPFGTLTVYHPVNLGLKFLISKHLQLLTSKAFERCNNFCTSATVGSLRVSLLATGLAVIILYKVYNHLLLPYINKRYKIIAIAYWVTIFIPKLCIKFY